jgi:MSHA biogenesis protein MshI
VSHRDQRVPRLETSVVDVAIDELGVTSLSGLQLGGPSLNSTGISSVLPDGSYQLLLEELPNAPREEMRSAVGWRIKDRIEMSLEDAVIELLEMPAKARGGAHASAYAIVTKREAVSRQIAQMKAAGMKPDVLDLPELCMRNLAIRLPQDQEGVAFLHFTDNAGLLTITRQNVLYLIRHIDIGQLQLDESPATQLGTALIPSICLELQRSLDYYEAHYDLPSVNTLVLGPGTGMAALKSAITEQLALHVLDLDLNSMFELDMPLSEDDQKACLFAVGAALRPDSATVWE